MKYFSPKDLSLGPSVFRCVGASVSEWVCCSSWLVSLLSGGLVAGAEDVMFTDTSE